jgi:hypothetical protein
MTQGFDRWLAVPDVVEPFGGISVISRGDGVTTLLLHSKDRDLRVTFQQIWALTIHEEFAHPDVDGNCALPLLPNHPGAYPLLTVTNSDWLKSFSDTRLAALSRPPIHYQFISMSYIVDVLSCLHPDATWVAQVPIDACGAVLEDSGA